jgi:hypothetical protein
MSEATAKIWRVGNEEHTMQIGYRGTYQDCEKACKTRKPKVNTQVSASGTAAQQLDTQTYDFFYKVCKDNRCPTVAGEECIVDCKCMDDFGEAASIMQSLRMAGQDLICSKGVAKPL